MKVAFLTRRVTFSAAHRYHRPEWPEARNREVFGNCANAPGHGHNYVLEVTVRGQIDPETGFSVDLAALDSALRSEVTQRLDHQHINHAVEAFGDGGLIPTTENLLAWLWPRLEREIPAPARLERLRLAEEPGFWVDYYGGSEAP